DAAVSPGHQEAAVRAEHHTPRARVVVMGDLLAAAAVPDPHGPVEAGRCQTATVWAEGDAEDRRLVLQETAHRLPRRRGPDLKFTLAGMSPGPAGQGEAPAVRTEDDLVDQPSQPGLAPAQLSRTGVVDLDDALLAGAIRVAAGHGKPAAVGAV